MSLMPDWSLELHSNLHIKQTQHNATWIMPFARKMATPHPKQIFLSNLTEMIIYEPQLMCGNESYKTYKNNFHAERIFYGEI